MTKEVKATMDLAQVDRTVIVEPSMFEDTLENVPIMKSLQSKSVTKKWQQRQKQDPKIRTIVQMIKDGRFYSGLVVKRQRRSQVWLRL